MINNDDADDMREAADYAKDLLGELIVMVLRKFPEDKNACYCLAAIIASLAHSIAVCARVGKMDAKGVMNIVRQQLKSKGLSKIKEKKQRPNLRIIK